MEYSLCWRANFSWPVCGKSANQCRLIDVRRSGRFPVEHGFRRGRDALLFRLTNTSEAGTRVVRRAEPRPQTESLRPRCRIFCCPYNVLWILVLCEE